jgi:hypothetical protein
MSVTRRSVLKGVQCTVATASVGGVGAVNAASIALVVDDSRLAPSRAMQGRHAGPGIDVAHERASLWRKLRAVRPASRVIGLTTWSELVPARGLLEEQRKRLRVEARRGELF